MGCGGSAAQEGCSGSGSSSESACTSTLMILIVGSTCLFFFVSCSRCNAGRGFAHDGFLFKAA